MVKRLLFVFMLIIFSSFVIADFPTYVNINITEKAHQNVTFAEFFDLEENVYDSQVEGWINISNPSSETVYDIMIELSSLSNLQTNLSLYDGRYGLQTVYTDLTNDTIILPAVTIFPINLWPLDLDHDNRTDFMWVNTTDLVIDLSSEQVVITIDLDSDIDAIGVPLDFDMDPIVDSRGRTLGWINDTVTGAFLTTAVDVIESGRLQLIEAANIDYVILHIPELQPGNYSVFTYNATPTIDPPLNVSTSYFHPQTTKVLAGECFNVTQTARDDFYTTDDLYNVNISMQLLSLLWNGSEFNFTFDRLFPGGDAGNVTNHTNNLNITKYWGVNGGHMVYGTTYEISYEVCAPASVPNSSTYPYLLETLEYYTAGTVTGIQLENVRARSDLVFNFTKRIDEPTNTINNPDVTWEVQSRVGVLKNISYNLTKVSLWVSETSNPNDFSFHKERYFPQTLINDTSEWKTLGSAEHWYFNYTDGSRFDAPPPIIWMIPYYFIADIDNQLIRTFETRNGNDYYMKYIYVVNGYWLEIQKNVTNVGEDQYNISINVWNRGNGYTPNGLTVTIYDFIPEEFTYNSVNFAPVYTADQNVSGSFNGTAIYWDVSNTRTAQNASFAPAGGINSTWNATYSLTGTGDYRVSQLYIVGLDPRLVDGGSAHEVITVASSLLSESTEFVYVLIVLTLVVVNVLNYVMVRRKK